MSRLAPWMLAVALGFAAAVKPPVALAGEHSGAVHLVTQTVAYCHKVCSKYQFAAYKACRERCASGSMGQENAKVLRHQKCLNSCQGADDVDSCTQTCVKRQKRLDF